MSAWKWFVALMALSAVTGGAGTSGPSRAVILATFFRHGGPDTMLAFMLRALHHNAEFGMSV